MTAGCLRQCFNAWMAIACVLPVAMDCRTSIGGDLFEKAVARAGNEDVRKLEDIASKIFNGPNDAVELTPDLSAELNRVESELRNADGKALFHRMLANHAIAARDAAREIREYRVVVEEYPDTVVAPDCAEKLMVRAEQTGDFAVMLSAAAFVGRSAGTADQKRDVQRVIAFALVGLCEYDEAVRHLETVASSEGASTWMRQLYNNVAVRLMQADQQGAAERLLMLAYESSRPDERDLGLLGNLSFLAKSQGRIEDSIGYQEEQRRLATDPIYASGVEFNIASNLFEVGRFDEARARYQAVLDSPHSSDHLSHLKALAAENIQNIIARTTPQFAPSEIRPESSSRSTGAWWAIVGGNVAVLSVVAGALAWRRHRVKIR